MPFTVSRASRGMSMYFSVVISPATTIRPVVISVSQATRLSGSFASAASRTASEIWSAILSGWPSVTDSDVKRKVRSVMTTERILANALAVRDAAREVRRVVRVDRVGVARVAGEDHGGLVVTRRSERRRLDRAHPVRQLLEERLEGRAVLARDAPVAVRGVAPVVGVKAAVPVDQAVAWRRARGRHVGLHPVLIPAAVHEIEAAVRAGMAVGLDRIGQRGVEPRLRILWE